MKIPAVVLATFFAAGVVLGGSPPLSHRMESPLWLSAAFFVSVIAILSGLLSVRFGRLLPAAIASALAWTLLGALGAGVSSQPRLGNHVLSLVQSGSLDLHSPLRWHGRLRDEPSRLPWGHGYEIELHSVEYQGAILPIRGGMRVTLDSLHGEVSPPDVHAGNEVAVVTEAKLPQMYRDDGAFDRRAYLAQQGVDLIATLRAPQLMRRTSASRSTPAVLLAHARRRLRDELDALFPDEPQVNAVLRAMLLGDRSFVDRTEATDFQKTGVFHVLVVAGLHVGALAAFLFWVGRKLKFAPVLTAVATLALLLAYVSMVEQRPPVLRAALMTAVVVIGGLFFRRLDLLNSAGIAALLLLVARPLAVYDSSFQLTFLALGCIAGLAVPWLEKRVQPYVKALRGWRDVTRDASCEPRATQFRIDLRSAAAVVAARLPAAIGDGAGDTLIRGIACSLRAWELFVITLVLQFGMLPLMARDFHRITLSAPFANLLAVPLTGVVVPLGFLVLIAGLTFHPIGRLLAAPLAWITMLLVRIVGWLAGFPRWNYRIPTPPHWLIIVFLLAGVLLAAFSRIRRERFHWPTRVATLAFVACALTVAVFPFPPTRAAGRLEMTVLDVGQGDSIFVVGPRGKTMLIDGGGSFGGFSGHETRSGPDPGEDAVSPYLWSRGFKQLDVVALTHAHQDHIGGLTAILENFRVGEVWVGREVSSASLVRLEALCRKQNVRVVHQSRAEPFSWDGIDAQFLWPEAAPDSRGLAPKNDDSIVLRLKFGERSMLLPGDAEQQAEASILREETETQLQSDVLKVGHHGSRNSTTPAFLAAVHPRLAVISVGEDNPYGHPNKALIERLEAAGVTILRTDKDGAVRVSTDGRSLDVHCFVACAEPAAMDQAGSARAQPPDEEKHREQ